MNEKRSAVPSTTDLQSERQWGWRVSALVGPTSYQRVALMSDMGGKWPLA